MATLKLVLITTMIYGAAVAFCPPMKVVESLDLDKLGGQWFEHASYGMPFNFHLDKCRSSFISVASDGKTLTFENESVIKLANKAVKMPWVVSTTCTPATGDLATKVPLIGNVPLQVIAVKYDQYMMMNLCVSYGFFALNAGTIWTRKRTYTEEELKSLYSSIDADLKKNNLSRTKFSLTNQNDCGQSKTPASSATSGPSAPSPAAANTPTAEALAPAIAAALSGVPVAPPVTPGAAEVELSSAKSSESTPKKTDEKLAIDNTILSDNPSETLQTKEPTTEKETTPKTTEN